MSLTKELVTRALTSVDDSRGEDLVTGGALQWVAACDTYATVKLHVDGADQPTMMQLAGEADGAIRRHAAREGVGVTRLEFQFVDGQGNVVFKTGQHGEPERASAPEPAPAPSGPAQPATPTADDDPLPNVKHVIAVGAGKGGVGKSTVAVNLAVGLARGRDAVGLLDGDIYGPSLPTMLGLDAMEQIVHDGELQPHAVHGVKAITLGKLVEADKPLIWRGPMAHGAFNQLVTRTTWGELDHMIIDLPPGTGDVPLTMAQTLKLTGAVIVCTPQKVAQDDAVRAVRMFQQLNVEILGVVENMSYFIGDDGKEYDIFGRGGAEQMAQRLGLPYLGSIPINMALRENGDRGDPTRNFDPETAGGEALPAPRGRRRRRGPGGAVRALASQRDRWGDRRRGRRRSRRGLSRRRDARRGGPLGPLRRHRRAAGRIERQRVRLRSRRRSRHR
jgi:ATP-binding protein involved in chromosome partitioning